MEWITLRSKELSARQLARVFDYLRTDSITRQLARTVQLLALNALANVAREQ